MFTLGERLMAFIRSPMGVRSRITSFQSRCARLSLFHLYTPAKRPVVIGRHLFVGSQEFTTDREGWRGQWRLPGDNFPHRYGTLAWVNLDEIIGVSCRALQRNVVLFILLTSQSANCYNNKILRFRDTYRLSLVLNLRLRVLNSFSSFIENFFNLASIIIIPIIQGSLIISCIFFAKDVDARDKRKAQYITQYFL